MIRRISLCLLFTAPSAYCFIRRGAAAGKGTANRVSVGSWRCQQSRALRRGIPARAAGSQLYRGEKHPG